MKTRAILAVALVGGLALAPFANAAAKPQVTDAKGDANAINGQGFVGGLPSQSTPVQAGSMDIQSIAFATDKKGRAAKNLVVTMTMGGDVTANELKGGTFRATFSLGDCAISLALEQSPVAANAFYARKCAPLGTSTLETLPLSGKVKGKTITFTANLRAFGMKSGAVLDTLGGHTRANLVAATAPVMDEASSTATYKVGS